MSTLLADALLDVSGLTVERGGRIVLDGLGFALQAGETVHVAGRNGAGKSTLLRTLAGLLHPAAGAIRYGRASDEVRGPETAHYLGYEDALKPSLTVRENLAFWAAMLGGAPLLPSREKVPAKPADEGALPEKFRSAPTPHPPFGHFLPQGEKADRARRRDRLIGADVPNALAAYGIARLADLPAGYLSAGQKRRVALARLLLAPRPIWLLDEPLIALDAGAQALVVDRMAAHTAAGGAILVASHQPLAATRTLDLDA